MEKIESENLFVKEGFLTRRMDVNLFEMQTAKTAF